MRNLPWLLKLLLLMRNLEGVFKAIIFCFPFSLLLVQFQVQDFHKNIKTLATKWKQNKKERKDTSRKSSGFGERVEGIRRES